MTVIPSIEITMHELDPPIQPRLRIDQSTASHPADLGECTMLTHQLMKLGAEFNGNIVMGLLHALDFYNSDKPRSR